MPRTRLDWGPTRRSTGPLQFTFLEGVARGDDGLVYAWEVQTERELAAEAAEDTGETGPDLDRFRAAIAEARPIELPGLPTCRVVTLGADPVFTRLLVDAASFGGDVVELITGAPAAARAAIFIAGLPDDDDEDDDPDRPVDSAGERT